MINKLLKDDFSWLLICMIMVLYQLGGLLVSIAVIVTLLIFNPGIINPTAAGAFLGNFSFLMFWIFMLTYTLEDIKGINNNIGPK